MSHEVSKLLPAIATVGLLAQNLPAIAQSSPGAQAYSPPVSSPPTNGDYYNSNNNSNSNYTAPPPNYQQGRAVFIPAGLSIPVRLSTSISTDAAQPGDMVEAKLSQPVQLADTMIPEGTTVVGTITSAKSGGFLGRAGMLTIKFNRLRLMNGQEFPMSAHIVGDIGKYTQTANGSDTVAGETWKNKVAQTVGRGVIGAGVGAALGTAVGAIAGAGQRQPWWMGGHSLAGQDAGRGAWSGAAIGGGVGAADGLILRKGKQVNIASGTSLNLQLDSPIQVTPPQYQMGYQSGQF